MGIGLSLTGIWMEAYRSSQLIGKEGISAK